MEIDSPKGKPDDPNRIWLPTKMTQFGSDKMVKSLTRDQDGEASPNPRSQQVIIDTGFRHRVYLDVLHVISSPFNDRTTIIFKQDNRPCVATYATSKNVFYIQCSNP